MRLQKSITLWKRDRLVKGVDIIAGPHRSRIGSILGMFLLALLISGPLLIIDQADGVDVNHLDYIIIDLQVDYHTASSGNISFFLGTGDMRHQNRTDLVLPSMGDIRNNNLMRMRESLGHYTENYRQLFRSILNSYGSLSLNISFFSAVSEMDYYGIVFSASFSFKTTRSSVEYEYLTFARNIKLTEINPLKPSTGIKVLAEEREMEKGIVRVEILMGSDKSLDLRSEGSAHIRTPYGERFSRTTDISTFMDQGNGLIISESIIFSPIFTFGAAVLMTLLGVTALTLIWNRNRFRRFGLILPITTAALSPAPLIVFYNPAYNIYGFHDIFLILVLIINTSLLTACLLVNPKGKRSYSTYEEEKGEKFEMPKVIYVDRTVFIEAKGSGKVDGLDPYDILGVNRNMSLIEIETAYKKEILSYHPDKFENSPESIKKASLKETERLNAAFEQINKKHGH